MRRGIQAAIVSILLGPAALAQQAFATASVKPVAPGTRLTALDGRVRFEPGGHLVANGVTVRVLIAAAYGHSPFTPRITGGPTWATGDRLLERFVVEAVSDPGTMDGLSPAQLREKMQPMLRRLLEERFKLVLRTEPKEMQVFRLTVAPSGAKLTKSAVTEEQCAAPAAPEACHDLVGDRMRGMTGDAVSMDDIASLLESSSDLPVVNATGLTGLYSIRMGSYSRLTPQVFPEEIERLPPEQRPPPEPYPDVFKGLEQTLGLRLERAKAQVEMLVVESVQRPDAN